MLTLYKVLQRCIHLKYLDLQIKEPAVKEISERISIMVNHLIYF